MWIKKTGSTFSYGLWEVQFTVKVQWAGLLKGFIRFVGRGNYGKNAMSRVTKQLYAFEEKKCSEQVYLIKGLEGHLSGQYFSLKKENLLKFLF